MRIRRTRAESGRTDDAPEEDPTAGEGSALDDLFDHQSQEQQAQDQPRDHLVAAQRGSRDDRDRPDSRRRLLVVLGVLLGVLLAATAVAGFVRSRDGSGSPAVAEQSPAQITGSPPPELPATGSAVRSRLMKDGDVVVTHWIRSRFPLSAIDLQRPTRANGAGRTRVTDITVVADGKVASGMRDAADSDERFVLGLPAKVVYVRYVLKGAVDTDASIPGRALVRTTLLQVDYSPVVGPTVVTVRAPRVLSMTCGQRGQVLSSPRPCGAPAPGGGWRVTLAGKHRQDQVMSQVDVGG